MLAKTPITDLSEKLHIAHIGLSFSINPDEQAREIIFNNHFGSGAQDWQFDVTSQGLDVIAEAKELIYLERGEMTTDAWWVKARVLADHDQEFKINSSGLCLRQTYEPDPHDKDRTPLYIDTPMPLSMIIAYR